MTDPQAIFAVRTWPNNVWCAPCAAVRVADAAVLQNLSGGGDEVTFETATRYIRDQHGVHTAQLSDEQLERMLDQADEDGAGALDEAAFTQFVEAVDAAAATPEDDPFAAPSGQAVPDSTEAAESMFAAGGGVDDGDDGADMFGGMVRPPRCRRAVSPGTASPLLTPASPRFRTLAPTRRRTRARRTAQSPGSGRSSSRPTC